MIPLSIHLDGDGVWPDLEKEKVTLEGVSRLRGGTTSGNSSVGLRIRMPDGKVYLAETTLRLFLAAADAFRAAEERDAQGS